MEQNENGKLPSTDILAENFNTLKEKLSNRLTCFENTEGVELVSHENHSSAVFPLTGQLMMEDFLSLIEDKLSVNILYALMTERGSYYEAMGYSKPTAGLLYIVMLTSHQHGVIDNMEVMFYESYEPMFSRLKESLFSLPKRKVDKILEQQKPEDVFKCFFK